MSCYCLKFIIGFLVVSFIFLGLPFIIYNQVVKPKNPTCSINQASVTGFRLTTSGQLTSFFDVSIRVHNPNHKLKLKYRTVRVSVFKDKQYLGTDALPGFTQRKGNVTVLRAEPVALNLSLKKGPAFDFGVESRLGYLDFDVFMTADLDGDNLEVNCKHVQVNVSASMNVTGNQMFQSGACSERDYSNEDGP